MTDYVFTSAHIGCYLDGSMGWHNTYRVIDLAVEHGWELNSRDKRVVDSYRAWGPLTALHLPAEETFDARTLDADDIAEWVHEVSEDATIFLDSITEPGCHWEWDMGELCLRPTDEEGWE